MRDCKDIDCMLYCQTEPVIETSSDLRFGCFHGNYPLLESAFGSAFVVAPHVTAYCCATGQFAAAHIDPLVNKWWQIYDFSARDRRHWRFMEPVRLPVCPCAQNLLNVDDRVGRYYVVGVDSCSP